MNSFKENLTSQKGFTIIEIMVAMSLIVLIFAIVPITTSYNSHSQLQKALSDFERAVRFANNEAILRNKIVRIKIILGAEESEYTIEYGTNSDLILPESVDTSKLSIKEREEEQKKQQKLDSQFSVVDELYDENKKLPAGTFIYGVATSYYENLLMSDEMHIYFYPTGERDNALILLHTDIEMASLSIPPFEQTTYKDYYTFTEEELLQFDDTLESTSQDIYTEWIKD